MEAAVVGSVSEKLVDGVVDQLFGKLISVAKNKVSLVLHLDDEICFLRDVLPKLKEVILSAEVRPETEEMRILFQHFAGDAEDILDEFDTTTAQRRLNWHPTKFKSILKVRDNLPSSSGRGSLLFRVKFANKIKGLYGGLEKLKGHLGKRRQFVASAEEGLRLVKKEGEEETGSPRRPITDELLSKDFRFVGRDKVKKEVIDELLSETLSKPSVVIITGMGGIGKTTLVQDILRQPYIVEHFEFKKWVCVGDELDPIAVMKNILGRDVDDRTELRLKLEGKRFLIVLDDCWSGKLSRWNELWDPLSYGGEGSKVIITSRDKDIGKEFEALPVKSYELGLLSHDECLKIFESYAFPDGVPSCSIGCDSTSRLREIGGKIVHQKIKGVPLAARVLGSSLRRETREHEWNSVLEGVAGNNITSVLMWSYQRLPAHLKQCFAYWSLFPKDYTLHNRDYMVWMWIACGYVQPMDNHILEYIGENYFDYLVRASLIQPVCDREGNWEYTMHDLVHDLAINVFGVGYLTNNDDAIEKQSFLEKHLPPKKLRMLVRCNLNNTRIPPHQLQFVRVLAFDHVQQITTVNFGVMIHLRFLDLSKVQSCSVPESVCSVYNLQTLLLNYRVENFPLGTWKLPNLRHLVGGPYIRMVGIGISTLLQTLNYNWSGQDIEELQNLDELRGVLRIWHLNQVQSKQTASKARLKNKQHVMFLGLEWDDSTLVSDEMQNDILENLCPHENLRILELNSYIGYRCPSWMGGKHLTSLQRLSLSRTRNLKELPPVGHLRHLEYLHIRGLDNIRCIGNGFYGIDFHQEVVFPSLKQLHLKEMPALEEWREITSHNNGIVRWFPSLELLEVQSCMELRGLPRLPKHIKRLIIWKTGLKVLPEIWTHSDDSNSYVILYLEKLQIENCPFLYADEWFRKFRMPSLSRFYLSRVAKCTGLVVHYSRQCLALLSVRAMPALESITLSALGPTEEFPEFYCANHCTIELMGLDSLNRITIVNCEDGKITAGRLHLTALMCNPIPLLQENGSKFEPRRESTLLSGDFV